MKSNKYKAIISDIDGTIAPLAWYPTPSRKVRKAIADLNKRNFIFSLSTGKPFYLIEHLIKTYGEKAKIGRGKIHPQQFLILNSEF